MCQNVIGVTQCHTYYMMSCHAHIYTVGLILYSCSIVMDVSFGAFRSLLSICMPFRIGYIPFMCHSTLMECYVGIYTNAVLLYVWTKPVKYAAIQSSLGVDSALTVEKLQKKCMYLLNHSKKTAGFDTLNTYFFYCHQGTCRTTLFF